jgi:hypothetical protein
MTSVEESVSRDAKVVTVAGLASSVELAYGKWQIKLGQSRRPSRS